MSEQTGEDGHSIQEFSQQKNHLDNTEPTLAHPDKTLSRRNVLSALGLMSADTIAKRLFGKSHNEPPAQTDMSRRSTDAPVTSNARHIESTEKDTTSEKVFSAAQWETAMEKMVHSDNVQSVVLPDGDVLWVFGDTTKVKNTITEGAYGFPHSFMMRQKQGTLDFTPIHGKYGYDWQPVPNFSENKYFWMSTPIVDKGNVYVLGEQIEGVDPFKVTGTYMAELDAKTFEFRRWIKIPSGATGSTQWGGVTKGPNGWLISGSHKDGTKGRVGDLAEVPFGQLHDPGKWKVTDNTVDLSENIGATSGIMRTENGYAMYTKRGDEKGSQIACLEAATPTGPWKTVATQPVSGPPGTKTYAVAIHPEQAAPPGKVLVSYAMNPEKKGHDDLYHPGFTYMEKP